MRMRGGVEVGRVEAPVEEGEQGRYTEYRHDHGDPHAPHHVAGLYGVDKGRVEDPGREVEQEPAALWFGVVNWKLFKIIIFDQKKNYARPFKNPIF